MTELGNRLKEARLAKGLSLDDLQSMTKIQKRYLIGIEEGNYASMPGNFYVRAFIKQ
ncbi:MAG: helix-turn-helix domain-containing protein, partial [Bacillus sp. (in: firmicutes)]